MKRIWYLGASDPEMEAIEKLLRECGEQVVYARDASGLRVKPHNAAHAVGPRLEHKPHTDPPLVLLVECRVEGVDQYALVDHHSLGDPGYGRPPQEFIAAASIGQVVLVLATNDALPASFAKHNFNTPALRGCMHLVDGQWLVTSKEAWWVIPHELVLTAAADHCLNAAYRGECPGVDPEDLLEWRTKSRATVQGRSAEELHADIRRARDALEVAAPFEAVPSMADMRGWALYEEVITMPDGYEARTFPQLRPPHNLDVYDVPKYARGHLEQLKSVIPELPEAAARSGKGYVSGPLESPDGRRKFTASGRPEEVAAWMKWAEQEGGLQSIYGDPLRGFAGGYEA